MDRTTTGARLGPRRRTLRLAPLAAILLSAFLSAASCAGKEKAIFIDEAFKAILPSAAAGIGAQATKPGELKAQARKVLGSSGTAKGSPPRAILASPLAAIVLAGEIDALGLEALGNAPPTLALFSSSLLFDRPWMRNLDFDYGSAYAAMGRKAAAEAGGGAKAAIFFQRNFLRGQPALKAFVAAAEEGLGPGAVIVREIAPDPSQIDLSGFLSSELDKIAMDRPRVLVLALDDSWAAWSAARDARSLFGEDLKAVYADQTTWTAAKVGSREAPGKDGVRSPEPFDLRLEADQAALARAALRLLRALEGGRDIPKSTSLPLRLRP